MFCCNCTTVLITLIALIRNVPCHAVKISYFDVTVHHIQLAFLGANRINVANVVVQIR